MVSLLLALALGSCSSDEPDNNGGTTGGDELGYVAVNIVQPKSTASRAFEEADFSNGDFIESIATDATFFVFNKDGDLVGNVQKVDIKGTELTNPVNPAVEKIYSAVVVINGVTPQPNEEREYQLVCVLNDNSAINEVSGLNDIKTLTELKEKYGDYRATRDGESFNFIMTNSVYKDGTSEVLGAVIGSDYIKTSAEEAKAKPVDVYVERVVAKINASEKSGGISVEETTDVPNTDRKLKINITGIEIANIANNSYLFKNINSFEDNYKTQTEVTTAPSFAWVWDTNNKRSYWETVLTDLAYENQSYNEIINHSNLKLTEYVQPNTNQKQKTAVLVTAQLTENGAGADLAYIRGQYTTNDGALKLVAQAVANKFDYLKAVTEGDKTVYRQLDYSDFEWVNKVDDTSLTWLARYEVVAKLSDEIDKIYAVIVGENGQQVTTEVVDTDTEKKLTEFNDFLRGNTEKKSDYTARVYTDGKCYYFVNIDQTSVANGNKPAEITSDFDAHTFGGVVRNHVYNLTLNSIGGIGVPVFDPNDKIIPETIPDEQLYYVAAQIKVLDWKLVNQTIDFTGK